MLRGSDFEKWFHLAQKYFAEAGYDKFQLDRAQALQAYVDGRDVGDYVEQKIFMKSMPGNKR